MMFFVLCYAIKGEEKYFIQIILYIKYIIDKFHKLTGGRIPIYHE